MKSSDMLEKIEDNQLKDISGGGRGHGKVAQKNGFFHRLKNFFGFGKDEENRKGNFLDNKGVYHINCIKCGKEIKSLTPMPNSCYACGPQVCDDCKGEKTVEKADKD